MPITNKRRRGIQLCSVEAERANHFVPVALVRLFYSAIDREGMPLIEVLSLATLPFGYEYRQREFLPRMLDEIPKHPARYHDSLWALIPIEDLPGARWSLSVPRLVEENRDRAVMVRRSDGAEVPFLPLSWSPTRADGQFVPHVFRPEDSCHIGRGVMP